MNKHLILRGILSSIVSRIVVNSIVIFSIFVLTRHFWYQMAVILPIIISIPTSIIFIKTDDLKRAIIAGISSGILTGIYFLSYVSYESFQIKWQLSPQSLLMKYLIAEHLTGATNWGMLFMISLIFTLFLVFSCSIGSIISYIRDRYRKNKECREKR